MATRVFSVALTTVFVLGISATAPAKPPEDIPGNGPSPAAEKVLVCHKNHHTISISESALPAHEAHGDWIVDDDNPCPAEGEEQPGGACLGSIEGDFDIGSTNHPLSELTEPLFDMDEGLVYLPQVEVVVLGLTQYYAVILQRISDTDFIVRHVEALPGAVDGVTAVGFNGVSTTAPFSVAVVPEGAPVEMISDIEFSVLGGCVPVQLSVTNFVF